MTNPTRPIRRSARPIELLRPQLANVRQTGPSSWISSCPVHDDRDPSLSITERSDHVALVYCHAGCSTREVLGEIGLTLAHLFPVGSRASSAAPMVPQTPTYSPLSWGAQKVLYRTHKALTEAPGILLKLRDEKGIAAHVAELAQLGWGPDHRELLIPYGLADGTPVAYDRWRFRQDRDVSGQPSRALRGHARPLYVPSAVLAELAGSTLIVAEGPLDALTACSRGYPAVAAPSASAWKPDAADWIVDLGYERVIVVGDCDKAGRSFADRASRDLAEHQLHVGVLDLDVGRHDGYDLGEFLLAGGRLP